ncbi:hypothetical protein RchiOBHm_Chr4g0386721 [Rosa chinensis]|uniref:Uncharacterized protein n=1 Tax=Rosa chinensis TaxID=74649 RepID=A0A2P6QPC1_ROSCH|nr:hypothetical protein RchiOBHm_Chr4g0386721 [Rosa chinensis]
MLEMNLWNCHRFSYSLCYDMMENILLNNQVSQYPVWSCITR